MQSDSKNKNIDKNKINKSSIELLKKSPLINSYLIRRKNENFPNNKSGKVTNPPTSRASAFHKTVQTVINMMKNGDSKGYSKGRQVTKANTRLHSNSFVAIKKPFSTLKKSVNKDFIRRVYKSSADTKKYSVSFFFEKLKKYLLNYPNKSKEDNFQK
jgi:hypothetical protein